MMPPRGEGEGARRPDAARRGVGIRSDLGGARVGIGHSRRATVWSTAAAFRPGKLVDPAAGQDERVAAGAAARHRRWVAAGLPDAVDDPDLQGIVEAIPDEAGVELVPAEPRHRTGLAGSP